MTDTLELLRQQNTREVWLRLDGDTVHPVPPGTPGAARFVLARVPAREIQSNLLYAALGRDGYVAYASWYNNQAQTERETAEASARKPGDPEPFSDTLPNDAHWRAHSLALETATDDAVLAAGMFEPTFEQAGAMLGPYRSALVRELVQWGRTPPAWSEQPKDGDAPNLSSANSVPP